MTSPIVQVRARRIWDSRGRPTVEAEVELADGSTGRAAAPAGASKGAHEAQERRDGGEALAGLDVAGAVEAVAGPIARGLEGMAPADQTAIDGRLAEIDGTSNFAKIGANASVAVSIAAASAAAASRGLPLWRFLAGDRPARMPVPEIQIFGGGAHAGGRVDVQDFMIVSPAAGSIGRALEIAAEVYRVAGEQLAARGALAGVADEGGWWPAFDSCERALDALVQAIQGAGLEPGRDAFISLDIAASQLLEGGVYRFDGGLLSREDLIARLQAWTRLWPILSIEDPVAEDDLSGAALATQRLHATAQVVGDDLLVTSAERVARAASLGACTALLVKPNQAGTLTQARAAFDAAKSRGWATILSARSGETEDSWLSHLAVGWDAGQIKVGSLSRSERMAKWNELIRIEEAMGRQARWAGWGAFAPGLARS